MLSTKEMLAVYCHEDGPIAKMRERLKPGNLKLDKEADPETQSGVAELDNIPEGGVEV